MTRMHLATVLLSLLILAVAATASMANVLPPEVTRRPGPVDPTAMFPLSGKIPQRAILMKKARVVIGYVSNSDWALVEFLTMTHASWRHMLPAAQGSYKIDLLVFSDSKWAPQLQSICTRLDLDKDFGSILSEDDSQCFTALYPPPPKDVWNGYPFINNVHFFADNRVQHLLKRHYGYAMKTDFDTFLSPTLLNYFPNKFTFGVQQYVLQPSTGQKLQLIAKDLDLYHRGQHNLGPAWYGDVATLVSMANASIAVLFHIITKEFEQTAEGGIAQRWDRGEGWPEWCAGIAALYATEITANHMIAEFDVSDKFDQHADSKQPLSEVYHLHCRHGDRDFNKFDFFKHHYDHVTDLSVFDRNTVVGYTSYTAISTWREIVQLLGRYKQKEEL